MRQESSLAAQVTWRNLRVTTLPTLTAKATLGLKWVEVRS